MNVIWPLAHDAHRRSEGSPKTAAINRRRTSVIAAIAAFWALPIAAAAQQQTVMRCQETSGALTELTSGIYRFDGSARWQQWEDGTWTEMCDITNGIGSCNVSPTAYRTEWGSNVRIEWVMNRSDGRLSVKMYAGNSIYSGTGQCAPGQAPEPPRPAF